MAWRRSRSLYQSESFAQVLVGEVNLLYQHLIKLGRYCLIHFRRRTPRSLHSHLLRVASRGYGGLGQLQRRPSNSHKAQLTLYTHKHDQPICAQALVLLSVATALRLKCTNDIFDNMAILSHPLFQGEGSPGTCTLFLGACSSQSHSMQLGCHTAGLLYGPHGYARVHMHCDNAGPPSAR